MQTTANSSSDHATPVCVNCAHHLEFEGNGSFHICAAAPCPTDPVTGSLQFGLCSHVRATGNLWCGPAGLHFKPRTADSPLRTGSPAAAAPTQSSPTSTIRVIGTWLAALPRRFLASAAPRQPDQACSAFSAQEQYAAGLAVECFGADAPETLRFVKHIIERSGKTWLTDRAPADPVTPETQA